MRTLSRNAAIFILLTVTTVFSATVGFAQAEGRSPGKGEGGFHNRMGEALGLTAEQQTRLDEIRNADREALRAARQNVAAKRRALDEAIMADTVDQGLVETRTRELSEAHDAMVRLMTAHTIRTREVLTPEQRERARTMRNERGERHERNRKTRLNRTPTT